ncbi:MAG: hypothetical protein WCK31_02100, partial [bacterium]
LKLSGYKNELESIFEKHKGEGNPFKCTSGEPLNISESAFCKSLLQDLNHDCNTKQTEKSGSLSETGKSVKDICFADVVASTTQGLGNLGKLLTLDTKEQATYQNYCVNFKKQTGVDCTEMTSEDISKVSSQGSIDNKYTASGPLDLFARQLSYKSNEDLQATCENQKARGFLPSYFDCKSLKQDQTFVESTKRFSDFMSTYATTMRTVDKETVLNNLALLTTDPNLNQAKLRTFLSATSQEEIENAYKSLYQEFIQKTGGNSQSAQYALSMYSYADCISNPNKKSAEISISSDGFVENVNPNCKTETLKVASSDENGWSISEVKRCASRSALGFDSGSYGKSCNSEYDCNGGACVAMTNGVENYYISRSGTKLPNGETIDISQEVDLRKNIDKSGAELAYLSSVAVLGSTLDLVDIATGLTKSVLDKAVVSSEERDAVLKALEYITKKDKRLSGPEELVAQGIVSKPELATTIYQKVGELRKAQLEWSNFKNQFSLANIKRKTGKVLIATRSVIDPVSLTYQDIRTIGAIPTFVQEVAGVIINDPLAPNYGISKTTFNAATVVKDISQAEYNKTKFYKEGNSLSVRGVTFSPIDPKTGENLALNQTGGYWSFTDSQARAYSPKIYYYAGNPATADALNRYALQNGISVDEIKNTIAFFEKYNTDYQKVGGVSTAGYPNEVIGINLDSTVTASIDGTDDLANTLANNIFHECEHACGQATNFPSIADPIEMDAIRSIVEPLTDFQAQGLSQFAKTTVPSSSATFKFQSGYNQNVVYKFQSMLYESLEGGQTDANKKIVDNWIWKISTDPIKYSGELFEQLGKGNRVKGVEILSTLNDHYLLKGGVQGTFEKVLGTSTSNDLLIDNTVKISNQNTIQTDANGILTINECSASSLESNFGNIVRSYCDINANYTLYSAYDTSLDPNIVVQDIESGNTIENDSIKKGIEINASNGKKYKVYSVRDNIEYPVALLSFVVRNNNFESSYVLSEGWQTFSPVFDPGSNYTASTLLKDIASQGGYATDVSTYKDGKWYTYKIRGEEIFSDSDFQIKPGQGYFIKIKKGIPFRFTGKPLQNPSDIKINNGWNLIGVVPGYIKNTNFTYDFTPSKYQYSQAEAKNILDTKFATDTVGYSAFSIIKTLNKDNRTESKIVTKWDSGRYTNAIIDKDSSGNQIEYGEDYYIDPKKAYFVRVDKNTVNSFTP